MNNGSHLKQIVALGKWVTSGKMGHPKKCGLYLQNRVTLGKMGNTWKDESHMKTNGSYLRKWITLENKGHTLKNG